MWLRGLGSQGIRACCGVLLSAFAVACEDGGTANALQSALSGLPASGSAAQAAPVADGAQPPLASDDDLWCDALSVMRQTCHTCHGPQPVGSPMALASWEDTQAPSVFDHSTPIYELIGQRIHDAGRPMPPLSQEPLTDDQKAALDAWIAAGAPSAADPACGIAEQTPEPAETQWPADCEEHYLLTASDGAGGPYVVPANSEDYPDFYFEVPWGGDGPVQALAFRPITDNQRVLHHWILYHNGNFLVGWAPGNVGFQTRPDVGIYLPDDGTLLLDMHYYNLGNPQEELDQSGVDLCVTRSLRPNSAAVMPFTAPATAPPNQRVVNQDTCTVVSSEPVFLTGSSPHMHQLGVYAKLEVLRPDGTIDVLHDAPFSFEDQRSLPLPAVQVNNGDQIRTTCVYENHTSRTVTFGNGGDDEMCFNFSLYYPMCAMRCVPSDLVSAIIYASQGAGCPATPRPF